MEVYPSDMSSQFNLNQMGTIDIGLNSIVNLRKVSFWVRIRSIYLDEDNLGVF